jgi:hypothetical protein
VARFHHGVTTGSPSLDRKPLDWVVSQQVILHDDGYVLGCDVPV